MNTFKQGHFDELCGLYAVINATRLTVSRLHTMPRHRYRDLFTCLTETLIAREQLCDVLGHGVGQREISEMLKHADRWLSSEHGLRINYAKPFHNRPLAPIGMVLETLIDHVKMPGGAAIVRLTGPFDHWTVLREAQRTRFVICDSLELKYLPYRNCDTKPNGKHSKRYRIVPTALFLIDCQRAS